MVKCTIECNSHDFKHVDMFLMGCKYTEVPPIDEIKVIVDDSTTFEYETERVGNYWYIITK